MSWQLAAFGVLALALAGGFAWYERARPDARIVALVATLAAFAALGRIAFAALPNVKPTTDIVLISGYALGGAPGFAVGALAGLSSNFFFGQGPWTPWQMAAWGATGIIGAGLALLTKGRIGRWPLAIACALVGYAFTAVQDFGDWVTFSDHSARQLAVYVARGASFDLVHAGGCLLFALAFGPALMRSIQRFARRLQVTWRPADARVAAIVALACAIGAAGACTVAPAAAHAASTPAGYLLAAQNGDGGFGQAPGSPSLQLPSGWAALGLAAAGYNPRDVGNGGASLLAYEQATVRSLSDAGALERTILVAHAAGASAQSFGAHDLVAALQGDIRSDGSVSDQVNLTTFALLALRAAGVAPARGTLSWLARQQNADGGFSSSPGGGTSDVDDTGAALEALAPAGRPTPRAVAYLRAQQNADGGFPAQPGAESNAQSTAWAVQGLLAAGVDPGSLRRGSPLGYLRSLIAADGHVRYSRSSDQTPVWVTGDALMALAGKPLPIAPVPQGAGGHPAGRRGGAGSGGRGAHSGRARRAAHGRAGNRTRDRRPASMLQRLAADAGLTTALLLAPVGLG